MKKMTTVPIHQDNLLAKFQDKIAYDLLWNKNDRLFLACSGGLDSVVLAHLLKNAGISFTILHCNFQLRGEESSRDEKFVQQLAQELGVSFQVKHFDTPHEMEIRKKGVQETARVLRYEWFDEVLSAVDQTVKSWLLTAHHADDQVETMMMQFFRGTGIAGLKGMKIKSGRLVRPLLFATRNELHGYARQEGLIWVEDSSNATDDYTRNFVRHKIIPLIEEVVPAFKTNMINNSKRFEEIDLIYQDRIQQIKKRLLVQQGKGFAIPVNKLKNVQPLDTILFEIFKDFGFSAHQVVELKKMLEVTTGKYVTSDLFRVLRNRAWLLIEPKLEQAYGVGVVEFSETKLTIHDSELSFQSVPAEFPISNDQQQALLNLKKIKFPLLVRKWKAGDYFYPLGMKKKKKLSRFLTDLKLSLTEKESQLVIESDKKIIWVVGRRIDDRFKVDEQTAERLLITTSRQSI